MRDERLKVKGMKRVFRYLMVLLAGMLFFACNDDVLNEIQTLPIENDEYVGNVRFFKLGEETEELIHSEVRCYLMTEDGETIVRSSRHTRIGDSSEIEMGIGLKDGIYRLLYFEFDLPNHSIMAE